MKPVLPVFAIVCMLVLSACTPKRVNSAPSSLAADAADNQAPTPETAQLVPEVSTTMPEVPVTPDAKIVGAPPVVQSSETITMEDNGKTFNYHVGDSFMLDLGAGVYEWTVTIDNPDMFTFNKGVPGSYRVLQTGTALLSAVGEPLCLKSNPPCGMPTVLFKVTLVVE